ncbi:NAD(P)-dependent dehydrogenase (short-subunit alcohol dehydrogenase family) [Nonomuraea thailandensis]|uniref:NAD(P)-dependent dehydrogenase (Short-subunit alcohol dehydrogenase family) n=1 Tax=Nonomuraea thailandensis TaxID=1188745 RepID=A0A9X2GMZ1_9ACTN|nr:oxidoreductase [Nonomuraea thailandensis]MCP2357603.1 NAD(P)-dependent dehydrogenase (short-subunit alcohol dehydrogenase family) [Nonomuraea thailandensis]
MRTSAAWTLQSVPDQTGRVAVVTGANSGIGYVTARELARRGAHVVLACRDPGRGGAALARMREEVPGARLELRQVDLASLASIREFAAGWRRGPLDLLVNNAGVAMVPYAVTADGFESQFGIDHLGTFALTGLLLPHLLAAPDPRVVTVSSEGQRFARFDLGNLNAERGYRAAFAYVQAKRANLYFAVELQRRADAAGLRLRSTAVAPGLTRTNVLTGGANGSRGRLYAALARLLVRVAFRPPLEGAKTSLYAATEPDLPGGSYIVPGGPLQLRGEPVRRTRERAIRDAATAAELWRLSERLTGVGYLSAAPC